MPVYARLVRSFFRPQTRLSAADESYQGREDPVMSNLHDVLSVGCSFGFVCIKEAAVKSLLVGIRLSDSFGISSRGEKGTEIENR